MLTYELSDKVSNLFIQSLSFKKINKINDESEQSKFYALLLLHDLKNKTFFQKLNKRID